MKIARTCPECGEVTLANKCKSCGHEFMPETPKPKVTERKEAKKKPKRPGPGEVLEF